MPTFPKPRPAALERKDRKSARDKADRDENQKVRGRSGGLCEAVVVPTPERGSLHIYIGGVQKFRCTRRAVHIHHRLSGIGVRARGASALAANKFHLCDKCHRDIHAHILVPDGDYYRRVR